MKIIKDLFIGDYGISQLFGENPKMYQQFSLNGHNGIDFRTPTGTQLVCCFDEAEIIEAYDDKTGYGIHLKIWDKKQKLVALYGHCKELKVKEGDIVKFGQLIAISDNTGFSTGPHTHFGICEVDDNCKRLNTDNGYAGWVDPFDKSKFDFQISNLKEPINYSQPVQPNPSQDTKPISSNLFGYLFQENNFSEGDIREGMEDFKGKEEREKGIEQEKQNFQKKINELNGKIGEYQESIRSYQTELSTAKESLKLKNDEFNALQEKLENPIELIKLFFNLKIWKK